MAPAERPALDAAVVAGPAVLLKRDIPSPVPSDHLSDGGRSLTRRSRVRRKNSHRDDDSSSDVFSTSGDISSSQLFVKIPPLDARSSSSPKSGVNFEPTVPPRPDRSPRRLQPAGDFPSGLEQPWTRPRTLSSGAATSRHTINQERGRETCSENGLHRRGQRPRVLSLPRHAFRTGSLSDSSEQPSPLTPNAFNDIPPVPVFAHHHRFRHQPRDSGVTHQSTASSSLYPKSTSTDDSYLSPPSLPPNDIDDRLIITVDPEDNPHVNELHEMVADDVSYRLRLLMQNNYYLPPAHSKPFSEYPSLDTPKKSLKSSSPTFFDIFKVGKKKSATPDPKANSPSTAPMLRTTSDSSTLSGLIRSQQPAHPTQHPNVTAAPQIRQDSKKGRVVVVRERMEDIRIVAKQVEQDLIVREAERRRNGSEPSHSEDLRDGLVDPTDFVDLPPASLFNSIGVEASIGAALLADRLPPSSPGVWSVDTEDEAWRKALLHAAVGHSLSNSPAATPARLSPGSSPFPAFDIPSSPSPVSPCSPKAPLLLDSSPFSTPLSHFADGNGHLSAAPAVSNTTNKASNFGTGKRRELGQRITSHMGEEVVEKGNVTPSLVLHENLNIVGTENERRPSDSTEGSRNLRVLASGSYIPIRASSPTVMTTPLLPPPRHLHPMTSCSSDAPVGIGSAQGGEGPFAGDVELPQVAQDDATSRLSDAYESHIGLSSAFGEVTTPTSQHNSATLSAVKGVPHGTLSISESTTSGSHYSDDDYDGDGFHTPREHMLVSTNVISRPSLSITSAPRASSEYSQPSPTTSAFRDAFDYSPNMGSSPAHSVINTLGVGLRSSSELDDVRYAAVSPPPRVSSSLAHAILPLPPRHRRVDRDMFLHGEEEEPPTPTSRTHDLIHRLGVPDARLGSYPTSPISFFDAVEMQNQEEEDDAEEGANGEEGEDSSDDDEDDDSEHDSDTCTDDGDDDFNDEYESISGATGGYQSDSVGVAIIDPRPTSLHNVSCEPKTTNTFTRFQNSSSPQLSSGPSGVKVGFDNVPQMDILSKKQDKLHEILPDPPRVSESTSDRMKQEISVAKSREVTRPQTAGSRVEQHPWTGRAGGPGIQGWRDDQNRQDQAMRRLDGMLIEHMEREKEVLRRITTSLAKNGS